ncbi:MAG: LPS export ABC transporter permease LptG [Rhizobiaceae bacterium]|jgi:lipopolysaccharide export system permease protein
MIGGTLFRYFFRRYIVITLQFFAGVLVISYLADFTEFSRRASTLPNYSIGLAMLISALRVPLIIQTAIPFIILFSAMATLMTLNRKHELVIARSAGVSAWQFLAPLCLASLLIGVLTVTVFNPLAAKALSQAEVIEAALQGVDPSASNDDTIPWLRQETDEGTTVIGAAKTANRGQLLSDATFLRLDDNGTITERIDAKTATLEKGHWQLEGVTEYRPGKEIVRKDATTVKSGLTPEFIEETLAEPETIPFYELGRKIRAANSFGLRAGGFAMQYHSLIALPWLLVAMTLIAATVSMRFVRMGQSAPMILGGILAGFLLYVVSVLVKAFGSAGIVPPVAAAWFPVVVAMFFGITFLLHKEDG